MSSTETLNDFIFMAAFELKSICNPSWFFCRTVFPDFHEVHESIFNNPS